MYAVGVMTDSYPQYEEQIRRKRILDNCLANRIRIPMDGAFSTVWGLLRMSGRSSTTPEYSPQMFAQDKESGRNRASFRKNPCQAYAFIRSVSVQGHISTPIDAFKLI